MGRVKILAVDDSQTALNSLEKIIFEVIPEADIYVCSNGAEASELALSINFDIAFLEIKMHGMNGIELAKYLQKRKPDINIIFVTEYDNYRAEAFEIYVSGYVMKPATHEKIKKEIEHLRFPCVPGFEYVFKTESRRVRVQTFGSFEIFVDDIPVYFSYSKTKEFIAFLINRNGASSTNAEIIAALSEDGKEIKDSYFRNLRVDLMDTLEKLGCSDIISRGYRSIAIVKDKIECDYYDFLEGKNMSLYAGEYMLQYSWAESTNGWLNANSSWTTQ